MGKPYFSSLASKKKIDFPPGFNFFAIFLIFFALNLFWSKNVWLTLWYLLLFLSGALFWIISYNLKIRFKNFENLIVILGVIFAFFSLFNVFAGFHPNVNSFSLQKYATGSLKHHHIGNLWAVVLSILALKFVEGKKRFIWFALIVVGVYLIYLSQSRTAFIALIISLLYLCQILPSTKKFQPIFFVLIFLAVSLFLFTGRTKPTLLTRGYYLYQILLNNSFRIGNTVVYEKLYFPPTLSPG